jgi:aminobenzoyl-glutamate utilization protein B
VGDVTWVCPTSSFVAVTYVPGTPAHSWQAVASNNTSIAHNGVLYAGKVLAGTVMDLLNDPQIIEDAKAEHKMRLNGQTYKCPIPAGVKPRAIDRL